MSATVHRGAVVVFLALSAACGSSVPTSPTETSPSPSGTLVLPGLTQQPSGIPPPSLPPLSGPSRTFIFERAEYPVAEYTKRSRFILYDNAAFLFQYMNPGGSLSGQYRGSYAEENGVIGFTWAGSRYPISSDATGRLEGDSLKVEYDLNMQLSDFENAVYTRIP